jgi:hypothetical protein
MHKPKLTLPTICETPFQESVELFWLSLTLFSLSVIHDPVEGLRGVGPV